MHQWKYLKSLKKSDLVPGSDGPFAERQAVKECFLIKNLNGAF